MFLKPISYKKSYENIIASKIIVWMWVNIFQECFKILKSTTVINDSDIIREAILSGKIQYQDGVFTGTFTNSLSAELEKLGAKYSKYRKGYLLTKDKLPVNIVWAIDTAKATAYAKAMAINQFLLNQLSNMDKLTSKLVFDDAVNVILTDLQERVYKNAKQHKIELITPKLGIPRVKPPKPDDGKGGESPTGGQGAGTKPPAGGGQGSEPPKGGESGSDNKPPKPDEQGGGNKPPQDGGSTPPKDDGKGKEDDKDIAGIDATPDKPDNVVYDFVNEDFAKNYTNNLDFWIKNWTEDEIIKMRNTVGKMAVDGKSEKDIADYLSQQFGVSQRHAKFLARNETAIATTSYLAAKYKNEGFLYYKWHCIKDGRERPLHHELDGHVFRFDNPPIIDERTGQKGIPGQTYNCRCTFSPYIDGEFLRNRKAMFKAQNSLLEKILNCLKLKQKTA